MATAVLKYPLADFFGWWTIRAPADMQVLFIDEQHGNPQLWARVSVNAPPIEHNLFIAATGQILPDNVGEYLGSYMMQGGYMVYHVFKGE